MPIRLSVLTLSICSALANDAQADFLVMPVPKLSLAMDYNQGVDVDEYWYSEKLDGIRAYWTGKRLLTRNGHTIHAPKWFTQQFPNDPLDGELWAGRGKFHLVQQTVLDQHPSESAWRAIDFMVFDMPESAGDYRKRYYNIRSMVLDLNIKHLKFVEHYPIKDEQHLYSQLDRIGEKKGEGIMLRKVSSRYQAGRGTDLLKLKQYRDAEAQVIGYKPGAGRLLGKMGALLVKLPNGKEFYIGSGFSDEMRMSPPAIGSMITFRYNGYTHKGTPKFARFIRERVEP